MTIGDGMAIRGGDVNRMSARREASEKGVMAGLTWIGVLATMVLPVLLPGGYWWGPLWLALFGVFAALRRLWPADQPPREFGDRGWGLAIVLLLIALGLVIMAGVHDELLKVAPRVLAIGAVLLALVALHAWLPAISAFWGGVALGGMLTGAWSLWQRLELGVSRASGHDPLHAILYGNISLLTGMFCLAGVAWALSRPRRPLWLLVLLAGAIGGVMASVLSGTRGGWIAMPLILLVFQRGFISRLSGGLQVSLWLAIAALMAGLYLVPQTGVQQRISQAVNEVTHYLEGEPTETVSVSTRLEMWRGTGRLILEAPLLGHGAGTYHSRMVAMAESGELAETVASHRHAHNDLLDAWVKYGVPGVGMLITLYALPFWLFRSGLSHSDPGHRALAVSGLLLPVAFIDFGLTYSFMAYAVGVMLYGVWLVVIWTFYRHAPIRSGARSRDKTPPDADAETAVPAAE
ncbi:O-antigen ligase family protein [Halomonas marinisediminis]|uniref:O-antigen ligase family protein n=1 Tax=Halomonas marinisediminis TaxID=2546095 RepID=A0ABY2DA01_9GAMM|nr:O-antigen ligase family protein [Halomonas marinisediminis]TDB02890.1 O-antigen ligase family protein [Halomonas marinisediminis]